MRIRTKLILLLLCISLFPLIIVNFLYYVYQKSADSEQIIKQLKSVAAIQHSRIEGIYEENIEKLQLIKTRPSLPIKINAYNQKRDLGSRNEIKAIISHIIKPISSLKSISIFNIEGDLIASTKEVVDSNDIKACLEGMKKDHANLFGMHLEQNKLVLHLSGPMVLNNKTIGIIVVETTVKNLLNATNDYTGLGETGETILAFQDDNDDAIFITPTRFDKNAALKLRIPKIRTDIPITHAINGENNVYTDLIDYRGEKVISVTKHIEDPHWGIVVKIDKAEAFAPLEQKRKKLLFLTTAFAFIIIYLSLFLAKKLTTPIERLTDIANKIINGDISERANEESQDEIGVFGKTFNLMTQSLLKIQDDLKNNIAELKINKDKVSANAVRFNRWKESNFIAIAHSKTSGEIIDANDAFLQLIGYSKEELNAGELTWDKITPVEYRNRNKDELEQFKITGYWSAYEKEYFHKDGHHIPVIEGGSIYENNKDEYIVFITDLTKQKKLDEVLAKKSLLLQNVVDTSPDFIVVKDIYLKTILANKAFATLLNKKPQALIGHSDIENGWPVELVKGDLDKNIKGFEFYDKQVLKDKVIYNESNIIEINDKTIIFDTRKIPLKNSQGEVIGILAISRDITKRVEYENKLIAQQNELQRIVDSMVDAVITINEMGNILSFNEAATKLFGYSKNEIIGKNVNILMPIPEAKEHDGYIRRYLHTNKAKIIGVARELVGLHKNRTTFPLRISVTELPIGENGKRRFIGSCHDLKLIKHQEEIIRRTQKMDALGQLTGGIAHDYNNMLGVILGYAELLAAQLQEQPKLLKYVQQINHAGERGANLTRKLLSFSRLQPEQLESVNINQLINDSRDMLAKTLTSKINLSFKLFEKLRMVNLDPSAFEDMLLNLSINALHAMAEGGSLTFTTSNITLSEMDAKRISLKAGDYVNLTIEDTGCGMSAEIKSRIFEPFFSTKNVQGTGLGLPQVYGFIHSCGGTIDVYSEEGLGTRFVIYFPSEINKAATSSSNKLAEKVLGGTETILVVDDESALCEFAQLILQEKGYKVLIATSGKQALELLEVNAVDVLLTDIIMPKMTGYELATKAYQLYPNLLILFASGFQDEQSLQKGKEFKEPIISKPYNTDILLTRVRQFIDKNVIYSDVDLTFIKSEIDKDIKHPILWNESMIIDDGEIDQDHKTLLELLNRCLETPPQESFHEYLHLIVNQLSKYTQYHFKREEALMQSIKYPYFKNHREVHQLLISKLNMAINTMNDEKLHDWLANFLYDWLIDHIMLMDKAFSHFIKNNSNSNLKESNDINE